MKKPMWKASRQRQFGFACVRNTVTGEYAFVGKYGEIWQYSFGDTLIYFRAVIRNHRISRRYLSKSKWPINPSDESLITFPAQELARWIDILRVPMKSSSQEKLANQTRNEKGSKSKISDPITQNLSLESKVAPKSESKGKFPTPGLRTNLDLQTENLSSTVAKRKREG